MPIRHDRKVSILDVMGPVMVGPSSSHTAGTARLGRVAREILDEDPVELVQHVVRERGQRQRGLRVLHVGVEDSARTRCGASNY